MSKFKSILAAIKQIAGVVAVISEGIEEAIPDEVATVKESEKHADRLIMKILEDGEVTEDEIEQAKAALKKAEDAQAVIAAKAQPKDIA